MRVVRALLVGLLAVTPAVAQDTTRAPQVFLMTIGVGESIDARFGHNAIWIHDSIAGEDLVYNYGTFNFHPLLPFVVHFVQGRPLYSLSIWPLPGTMKVYDTLNRSIETQELNLPAAKRMLLAELLAENALPENRSYRYDYYLDNCSTRVRDMLDKVLDGALRRATAGVPGAGNLRFHTQRSIANNVFYYLGIMALMGPSTDLPLDQWGEMFLPEKVQERVRELKIPDASGTLVPLVKAEATMLDKKVFHIEKSPPAWTFLFLGVGSLIGLLIMTGSLAGPRGMFGRTLARVWLVVIGVGGLLLAYVWCFTNHVAATNNRNVLLLSPLALPLLFQIRAFPATKGRGARFIWFAFAGSIAIGMLLALFPAIGLQWNLQLAALAVPPSVAALTLSGLPLAEVPASPR